ncbi:MAG: hypothetical protein K2X91_10525, partial [Thermoleophilia bacterium]|nr:hypothetical protein [Thermoleophilia bacterium]
MRTRAARAAVERLDAARRKAAPRPVPVGTAGRPPRLLHKHAGAVRAVAFSSDGKTALSAGMDGKVRLGGKAIDAHKGGVFALAVSPDGKRFASAGADGKVRLWSLPAGHLVRTLAGHEGGAWSVAFGPGGLLASGGEDGKARLWDTDGKPGRVLGVGGRVTSLAFFPDGMRLLVGSVGASQQGKVFDDNPALAIGTGRLQAWPLAGGETLESEVNAHQARLSADGSRIAAVRCRTWSVSRDSGASGTSYRPEVLLFSPSADRAWLSLDHRGATDLSRDGRFVLTGSGSGAAHGPLAVLDRTASLVPRAELWESATGKLVMSFGVPAAVVALSPDGRSALMGTEAGEVRLADLVPQADDAPLEALWDALGSDDAARAYRAMRALAGRDGARAFLVRKLRPA